MTNEEAKEYLDNYRKMYAELAPERFLEALDIMLNEPSLPSNMDEAAEKYGEENQVEYWSDAYNLHTSKGDLIDAFKAGAKWMAEQGYTVEEMVWIYNGDKYISRRNLPENFEVGDEVIVQIRKK